MQRHQSKVELIIGLILVTTLLGSVSTMWLVNTVDATGLSAFRDFAAEGGAGITAFVGVGLYELFIQPWRT